METDEQQITDLLWDSLKRDPEHKDRRQTGWGTKTKQGLVACVRRITAPATVKAETLTTQQRDIVIERLSATYDVWMKAQKLPLASADEVLATVAITEDQRIWLSAFLLLWEATK